MSEQEQERVRRLLGDVAATDETAPPPVPADVAALLDERLSALARERAGSLVAPVVPLRRRLAPVLVAAAVALVVAGGVVAVDNGLGGSGASGGSSDSSAGSAGSSAEEDAPGTLSDPESSGGSGGDASADRMLPAPYLTRGGFAPGVRRLVRDGEVATGAHDADARTLAEETGCVVPDDVRGAATLVSLEGDPALVVVAAPDGGERRVTLLSCGDGRVVDETTVPATLR